MFLAIILGQVEVLPGGGPAPEGAGLQSAEDERFLRVPVGLRFRQGGGLGCPLREVVVDEGVAFVSGDLLQDLQFRRLEAHSERSCRDLIADFDALEMALKPVEGRDAERLGVLVRSLVAGEPDPVAGSHGLVDGPGLLIDVDDPVERENASLSVFKIMSGRGRSGP